MSAVTGISGIQLSAASAAYAPTNSAEVSAIASAYATGKQDALTFGYDAESAISSINGSGLAGGGATGDYVEKSAMEAAIGSANTATSTAFAQGWSNSATSRSFAQGDLNTACVYSFAQGAINAATSYSFAQGSRNSASACSFAQGIYISAKYTAAVFGKNNLRGDGDTATGDSAAFAIGDGTATGARHDLMLVTKDGEITMYSSTADTVGTGIMSSIRALSANAGGVDSATVSAIASSYAESAVSSKLDESATADFYSTSNPSGFITGVDLSDYATTAYVDSSVSSKLDTTAFNSGDFYTTANPSGFIDSAYVDSAVSGKADSSALSSYVPYSSLEYNTASAISGINGSALAAGSTYSAGEGIDITDDVISVETPVDIVAGPGIVIDNPDGNTLRVSMATDYEVELYKHTTVAETNVNDVFTMSEPITNFERIRIEFWSREFQYHRISFEYFVTDAVANSTQFIAALDASLGTGNIQRVNMLVGFNAAGNLVDKGHGLFYGNGSSYTNGSNRGLGIHRVVGIHRINGGN